MRVDDRGIGQHPDDFGSTLLSLNESNKVGKPYTMGTYGQGGSVTFGFSQQTVIISRRHPALLNGRPDMVGWTVVEEEEGDPAKNMLPWYVWMVKPDGSPLALPAECFPELQHGTRITHVEYDVQKLRGPFTTQAWQFLHATLVDPVLPFLLYGNRTKVERDAKDRVIIGNVARLNNPQRAKGKIDVAVTDTHDVDLGPRYGKVEVSYWALTQTNGDKKNKGTAESYVQAENAVSLTLHGQRQDAERRTWIKDRAQLPYLYKNMVVHINGNGLTPAGRRELFASTRERATESDLRQNIYDYVAELLRTDEDLKRLNHEEKEKLLSSSTAATNKKVRKRLGQFIKTKLKDTSAPGTKGPIKGQGSGPSTGTDGGKQLGNPKGASTGPSKRNTDDTNLPNVPTMIAFESKSVRVSLGFKGQIWVDIDAKNGYLPNHDDDLTIVFTGGEDALPAMQSRSRLLGGRSRWAIRADEDVPVGDYEMYVSLETANGLLEASIPVHVVEPPEPDKGGQGGTEEETGPDVRWVMKVDWDEHEMNAKTVGKVTVDDESTIIWVNRDFHLLAKELSSRRLTPEQVTRRADLYQFPVACGLWLQDHEIKKAVNPPTDEYQRVEMHRLAEAVLTVMNPDIEIAGVESED